MNFKHNTKVAKVFLPHSKSINQSIDQSINQINQIFLSSLNSSTNKCPFLSATPVHAIHSHLVSTQTTCSTPRLTCTRLPPATGSSSTAGESVGDPSPPPYEEPAQDSSCLHAHTHTRTRTHTHTHIHTMYIKCFRRLGAHYPAHLAPWTHCCV